MKLNIAGLTGNFDRFSKTSALVNAIVDQATDKYDLEPAFYNLSDFGDALPLAQLPDQLDEQARTIIQNIIGADVLVVGVPTYQASYPGMFKHLFDMIDPHALAGKPVILAATGGTERHALMIEHQLRPLFHYFRAATVPTAIYASRSEFDQLQLSGSGLIQRIHRATDELQCLISSRPAYSSQKQNFLSVAGLA
ncbi:MAG: NAD(P)H-dependent oxidoreductase [Pantoea agglomerans]